MYNTRHASRASRIAHRAERIALSVAILVAATDAAAQSSNGLFVASVKDYTLWDPSGAADIPGAHVEADGLWFPLIVNNAYTNAGRKKDNNVRDVDFHDPQLTGNGADVDQLNFDQPGTAISYVIAHGTCGDITSANCTSDAQCGIAGYCPGQPPLQPNQSKVCIAVSARELVTSSTVSWHGNFVRYGAGFLQPQQRSFALGESPSSGGFAGVGTNGGTNVGFIINSCGIRSKYWQSASNFFHAGVHSVMMAMPTGAWINTSTGVKDGSDARNYTARGSYIANAILTNQFSAVRHAWLNPTQVDNGFATIKGTGFPSGANIIMARDSSASRTTWHLDTESWFGARLDSNDANGSGFAGFRVLCNYNCSLYGM